MYIEGTSEKLRGILRSRKIGSTFYNENTLHKLLCKPKDQVVTEDKNIILYEIDCSNCEAAYFVGSKLTKIITFASVKLYVFCFRLGQHISFNYVWLNDLRCLMMGEVCLNTQPR